MITPRTRTADGLDFAQTETLRYQRPELPPLDDIARYYALSEEARFYANAGPCAQRLSARLAEYVGDVACVLVGNCTLGLMAALRGSLRRAALPPEADRGAVVHLHRDGLRDHVGGFRATLRRHRARVVAARRRRPGTRARQVPGGGGRRARVLDLRDGPPPSCARRWRSACTDASVPLLIDSAAGFGAIDETGRPLGSQGDTEVFSFHATKPFAIGEGGAVVDSDPRSRSGWRG